MSATTNDQKVTAESLQASYIHFYSLHGKPRSVYAFCDASGIPESEFYNFYSSEAALESAIWKDVFSRVFNAIESDENLSELSVKDRFTALSFAWIEALKDHRSFYTSYIKDNWNPLSASAMHDLRRLAKEKFSHWISEATSSGEIQPRMLVGQHYDEALWLLFSFNTTFWVKDSSQNFEKTDAAIEKSCVLAFDLMEKGALDSAFDLGKFLFQSMR